jgi:hypothetical protein
VTNETAEKERATAEARLLQSIVRLYHNGFTPEEMEMELGMDREAIVSKLNAWHSTHGRLA